MVTQITFNSALPEFNFRRPFWEATAMKRICSLVVLMLLSSSAHAGNSFSFVVGGHRIHIGAARHCRSALCVFASIPGVYETRRGRDRNEDRDEPAPAKPVAAAPSPQQVATSATVPPAVKPSVQPVASAPPATVALATSTTREVAPPAPMTAAPTAPATTGTIIVMPAPPAASIGPPEPAPIVPASTTPPASGTIIVIAAPAPPPIEPPPLAAPPAAAAPPVVKISHEDDAPTPLGDWQTEGKKGSVRIEPCGHALCGYVLNPSSNAAGETLLINMKPKTGPEKAVSIWSGNIFSRDSGNTYYATMTMRSPNSLRVEACALGRFFCSGNLWTRIAPQPDKLITSRQVSPAPPS
jgi:uncharacterized protein (DUF2147 family)